MKNSRSPDTEAYWVLFSAQGGGVTLPMLLEMTTLTHCPIGSYPTHLTPTFSIRSLLFSFPSKAASPYSL